MIAVKIDNPTWVSETHIQVEYVYPDGNKTIRHFKAFNNPDQIDLGIMPDLPAGLAWRGPACRVEGSVNVVQFRAVPVEPPG